MWRLTRVGETALDGAGTVRDGGAPATLAQPALVALSQAWVE